MSDFDLDVLVAFSGEIEDDGICETIIWAIGVC